MNQVYGYYFVYQPAQIVGSFHFIIVEEIMQMFNEVFFLGEGPPVSTHCVWALKNLFSLLVVVLSTLLFLASWSIQHHGVLSFSCMVLIISSSDFLLFLFLFMWVFLFLYKTCPC
ncbi:hypothetical protein E2542_SST26689 [Spatholobus suberectus]|nr:hypothetical protein E2542_SST26689 [Spatholobus suberectus]